MTVCFVELEAFIEEVLRVADEDTLRQFEMELAARPEAGDLIRQSGGLRKARMKLPGRGRSAWGARDLSLAAGDAAIRALHALHQGETGRHPARAARAAEGGSRNHQSQLQPMKPKTKKAEMSFDARMLVSRVEGFAAGRQPARERTIKLPPPVKPIPAKQIRAIRLGLGCTQTEFAVLLNVPAITAISWENGTRKPSGAALRLLAVARHHPEALHAA
jgi:putative transcriptional regulator